MDLTSDFDEVFIVALLAVANSDVSDLLPNACELNVLIVLDRSDSVKGGFNKSRQFVIDASDEMVIGPTHHRVAMIVYSGLSYRREVFPWNFAKSNEEFVRITNNLRAIGGTTNTKKALEVAIDVMAQRNKTIPTLIMVVTDGRSADDPKIPAQRLQQEPNTWVYAAATGDPEKVDKQELEDITGNPYHIVLHRGREHAADVARRLLRKAQLWSCNEASYHSVLSSNMHVRQELEDITGNPYHIVLHRGREHAADVARRLLRKAQVRCEMDLVLVFDFSTTTDPLIEYYKEMSKKLVQALRIGPHYTLVAAVTFATVGRTRTKFNLKRYKTQDEVMKAIDELESTGGTTAIGEGIREATKQISQKEGARPEIATKVMIIFTDGWVNKGPDPEEMKKVAIDQGFEIYAVSFVGPVPNMVHTNNEMLSVLAQDSMHIFTEKTFDQLIQKVKQRNLKCLSA
ncbi:von Willebrand factor type A domain protein [Dictyocaulus viviparus]|uniref:von Willebrand factor type A domain protein n=1 Tax=Dictyocaulus viviparus TaxID=29172 RepID=A0A0D8Y2W1_DICVI|nr:von Willebrand factor type A domain protein [Dictyocaulus viviparus]